MDDRIWSLQYYQIYLYGFTVGCNIFHTDFISETATIIGIRTCAVNFARSMVPCAPIGINIT